MCLCRLLYDLFCFFFKTHSIYLKIRKDAATPAVRASFLLKVDCFIERETYRLVSVIICRKNHSPRPSRASISNVICRIISGHNKTAAVKNTSIWNDDLITNYRINSLALVDYTIYAYSAWTIEHWLPRYTLLERSIEDWCRSEAIAGRYRQTSGGAILFQLPHRNIPTKQKKERGKRIFSLMFLRHVYDSL